MDYVTVHVQSNGELTEILISELFAIGYDSFQENEDGSFLASCEKSLFNESQLEEVLSLFPNIIFKIQEESKINWNEEWEKNYEPIVIADKCLVRATFHEPDPSKEFEIVITPKMSFGTGHHDTTYQILAYQMQLDFNGKKVLDAGCGTAILSIMSFLKGASWVTANDIDDWCIENSLENFELNSINENFRVLKGDISVVDEKEFDFILANINKNVLLSEIPTYSHLLKNGGTLLLSGFYKEDIPDLLEVTQSNNLEQILATDRNRWAMLALKKH